MQVYASSSVQIQSSSGAGVVAEVKRQAAILADGSGASDQEKISAYGTIMKAYADSADSIGSWFKSSTQEERDAVNAAVNNSSMSQRIRDAADNFNARGMRGDRTTNVMANQIEYLNGLSDLDQQLIFAGTAQINQTPTLESWKGFLQENADGRARQLADEANKEIDKSPVKVTLSDGAKKALEALTQDRTEETPAEAALRMLRKAAEERAEARDDKPYVAGDKIDTAV